MKKQADSTSHDPATASMDRDELMEILANAIRSLDHSIEQEPPDSSDAEELRLKRMRTLNSLIGEYRKLQKDHTLDSMVDDIEALKGEFADAH